MISGSRESGGVGALVEIGQVVSEDVAETPELGCALVGEAEAKGARRRHRVQRLQPAVVAQDVQRRAVRFPQELEPGRDQLPVCAVLQRRGEMRPSAKKVWETALSVPVTGAARLPRRVTGLLEPQQSNGATRSHATAGWPTIELHRWSHTFRRWALHCSRCAPRGIGSTKTPGAGALRGHGSFQRWRCQPPPFPVRAAALTVLPHAAYWLPPLRRSRDGIRQ